MELILCACGCGQTRPELDRKGRPVQFIRGHQGRIKTEKQRATSAQNLSKVTTRWNTGKSYVFANKKVYANKGAWNKALRRLYPDRCMCCGWDKAACDTHHIIPRAKGGEYSIKNAIILCPNCHRLAEFGILTIEELQAFKDAADIVGMIV